MQKCVQRMRSTRCSCPLSIHSTRHSRMFHSFRLSTPICMASPEQPGTTRIRIPSAEQPGIMNQHSSVDPEDIQVDLSSTSEPLGMPAAKGYGWAQLEFGDRIGDDNRYIIIRKLGWGMHSSTWLARDTSGNKFVAIKVLTGYMTGMYEHARVWETDAFRLVSWRPTSPHCAQLLDDFTMPGKGSAGSHICFVMPVYGGDVRGLFRARKTPIPLPLAKRIVLHLLRGIAHIHWRGVVHTDIKHDNIFFSTTMTVSDFEEWMRVDPSRRHEPEASYDGVVQSAISQPLPMIAENEAMQATYLLADFGCAQPSRLHANYPITSPALRPPESYLGADWDKPADIWTFGCLIFELITARYFFRYRKNAKFGLDETENMLYQMTLLTQEDFSAAQLQASPKAPEYFNPDCRLKKNPDIFNWPIKARFDEFKVTSNEEAVAAAELMERCLRLNPADRATAAELLNDRWFDGVE